MKHTSKNASCIRQPSKMKPSTLVLAVFATLGLPAAWAVPLDLSQSPAGTAGRAPAPNVILSLDDSGSMSAADSPDGHGHYITRDEALRRALLATFTENNPDVADGKIRLAWQMFNYCPSFHSIQMLTCM